MRILFYGAGVIGCFYSALFSEAGIDVTLLARGHRLESLREKGLRYKSGGAVKTARVRVIDALSDDDAYDFVFVTVREHQLYDVLKALKPNQSPNIVTMVNSLDTYDKWEEMCGRGRLIPAFPGAGGGFEGDILDAALTPSVIQPTTFAEISGRQTGRTRLLADIFRRSHIPCQIVPDMHIWQLCHIAVVVPLADAYYEAADPRHAGSDMKLMEKTALRIRRNLTLIKNSGRELSPAKINVFLKLSVASIAKTLSKTYNSEMGERFMYRHSMKAPDEMRELHAKLYKYLGTLK